ncbi:MAG TPA: LLM class flavin-dependent oxidoreductase [Ilumatobacteraceae bacterium]|nr:LLM class flavin-dependent oxidoreductase [Ilumatobacteraceae bacterium]HRB05000.1 LLM class flavin-dependent oxidoreductase [Ilumatobacteraceae bacterium]
MIAASVNLIPEAPVARMAALGRAAEDLGFTRCWVYDEGLATRDVYITLAAIAQVTSHIELGTGITNPYTRHPAATAAAIATLDELSGGRAFLGIGAGGSLTLAPLGIERAKPLSAVRDTMLACRALFSGQPVTMSCSGFELRGATLGFARPDLEIWLAGRGPRMLALGGELADGVMLDFIHKDTLGDYVQLVRGASTRRTRISYSTMIITDDEAMADTKPHMTYRLVDSPPQVRQLLGITDHEVAAIREAMADGLAAAGTLVRDEWVLPFVIAGTVDACATELAGLMARHDIDEFLLPVLDLHHADHLMSVVAEVLERT